MILAGDIGGTKTVLALIDDEDEDALLTVREEVFPSRAYATFDLVLAAFLRERITGPLRAACFGVAGPVIDGRCETTNLPWVLDEKDLAEKTGARTVKLLNDLEATAYGMLFLPDSELHVLQAGKRRAAKSGNVAVIAAGTGLGEATLYWDGTRHHPIASEGGHADFAPQTDQEIDLLRYLRKRLEGHVSWERILAGPGLLNVYEFLRDTGFAEEPAWLDERLHEGDPSAAISKVGLAGQHPLAVEALDVFAALYGAEAGNMALRVLATGGVFVGGGIAPKILPALERDGAFLRGFRDKGRFQAFLDEIRVAVALNPKTALVGASHYALLL